MKIKLNFKQINTVHPVNIRNERNPSLKKITLPRNCWRLKAMLHSVKLLLNRKNNTLREYLGFKEITHPVKLHPASPTNLIKELMKLRNKISKRANETGTMLGAVVNYNFLVMTDTLNTIIDNQTNGQSHK